MDVLVVVHRPSVGGGRRVTVRRHGRDEVLGVAYCDDDLMVFLDAAGWLDAERIIDDPAWVEWRGGRRWGVA
ncbi:hypothetical protein ACFWU3_29460 [Streptomyces sp. NPDC058685]|uniref:hypothetical protein n=1 Tax=Streptomyces sp. NPDC058685 TaxID=3346598 RepID=UPI00364603F8